MDFWTSSISGIEYSTGRCELWVRPGGIEASAAISGFLCLRYTGAPTTTTTSTTPSPWSFVPVDGGINRVCRGSSANDNSAAYYQLAASSGMSMALRMTISNKHIQILTVLTIINHLSSSLYALHPFLSFFISVCSSLPFYILLLVRCILLRSLDCFSFTAVQDEQVGDRETD